LTLRASERFARLRYPIFVHEARIPSTKLILHSGDEWDRYYEGAADMPFRTLFATILTVPKQTFAGVSANLIVRCGVQFAWGSWKLFELSALRLRPNCVGLLRTLGRLN
jgi:hypothetical protein